MFIIKRALRFVLPYKIQFAIILVCITINAFTRVYPVVLLEQAVNLASTVSVGDDITAIYTVGIQLAGFYLLGWILTTANQYFVGYISQHTTFDLRQEMFIKLQVLSLNYFDKRKTGEVISRVMGDVDAVNTLMTNGFPLLFGDCISIIFILILLFTYSWQLTLITFCVAPLIFLYSNLIARRARKVFDRSRQTIADVYTRIEQGVAGIKATIAFTREEESAKEFEVANRANRDVNIQAGKLMASMSPVFQTIVYGILAIILFAAFFFLRTGSGFELGKFVAFLLLILNFYGPIQSLAGYYSQIQNAFAAGTRIFAVLDSEIEVRNKPGARNDFAINGNVVFQDVYFHYDNNVPVLKHVNVNIEPRTSLAIVGSTGAGKTTFINLLCRFYDAISGKISIDGVDVKDITLDCLRKQLGIVLQQPFLFSDTVMENIRYGSKATDEQVIAVAKQIGAHEFIMDLEKGYQTVVREGGVLLSQGQRQLVSFARALCANPRILILDEATSSLDAYSELALQKAIEAITRDRTSIIIAHRLSTIRNATHIIVLEKGEIVEQGDHDELVELNGIYARMHKLQFKDKEMLGDKQ
jgi:ATP-binding cassette subfamily B protein